MCSSDLKSKKYTLTTEEKEEVDIAIPFKLLGMANALEINFGWIAPQNLFDESSQPKRKEKGDSQPYISNIQCLYDKFAGTHLNNGDAFDPEKT